MILEFDSVRLLLNKYFNGASIYLATITTALTVLGAVAIFPPLIGEGVQYWIAAIVTIAVVVYFGWKSEMSTNFESSEEADKE